MFSARAPHARPLPMYPTEQKVVPCTCLSSGGAPRGQARSGAPDNLRDVWPHPPSRANLSLHPFSFASPTSTIPLIGLSALPLRLRQASIAEALPRLSTSSLVLSFFLGALTFVARRAACICLLLAAFFFHVCETLILRDVGKKKPPPIQWLGLLRTDRYSSHQTVDLQQLFRAPNCLALTLAACKEFPLVSNALRRDNRHKAYLFWLAAPKAEISQWPPL